VDAKFLQIVTQLRESQAKLHIHPKNNYLKYSEKLMLTLKQLIICSTFTAFFLYTILLIEIKALEQTTNAQIQHFKSHEDRIFV
jgi:hypothetical protein